MKNIMPAPQQCTPQQCKDAWLFAARKHHGQSYPGPEGLPYLVHVGAVLLELLPALAQNTELNNELAMCCAVLHDTLEDTATTSEEIADRFGRDVAVGVEALTKASALHKEEAMRDSLERIRRQPPEIWLVKLADRAANLGEFPTHWTPEKCAGYAREARLILESLGAASPYLAAVLAQRIAVWERRCA